MESPAIAQNPVKSRVKEFSRALTYLLLTLPRARYHEARCTGTNSYSILTLTLLHRLVLTKIGQAHNRFPDAEQSDPYAARFVRTLLDHNELHAVVLGSDHGHAPSLPPIDGLSRYLAAQNMFFLKTKLRSVESLAYTFHVAVAATAVY